MKNLTAWWIFTKERFEPLSHITMIVVFIAAHILIVEAAKSKVVSNLEIAILFIGVVAFYFKLRLYDEVKDYELDVVINKHRPLPRGLLNHHDMYQGMAICIFIEMLTFSFMGMNSFISILLPILYSLVMYKEFFIREKIRPYLTTYALLHTIVTTFLSFAIFTYLTKETLFDVIANRSFLFFSFGNWLLFNIFEFGRKTFATDEERDNVDTYSSLFGRIGAIALVFSQALLAHYLCLNLEGINLQFHFIGMGILIALLFILSISYIITDSPKAAKIYRLFSSVYIILFYLILMLSYIAS